MSDHCECPICMDVIDVTKNCVVTDCGHKFHCSCLMQNAVHNGFGCPFCRTAMADQPKEEDDEDQWTDVSDEEEENELYDDYALRGLRFMTNNLEGVAHDILDNHDEDEAEQEEEQEEIPLPSAAFVTSKLIEQGVTMEYLVKALLSEHAEYQDYDRQFNDLDDANGDIFGKMRIIISNYTPPVASADTNNDEPATPVQIPVTPVQTLLPLPTPSAPARQPSSEPKTYATSIMPRRLVSEFMNDE